MDAKGKATMDGHYPSWQIQRHCHKEHKIQKVLQAKKILLISMNNLLKTLFHSLLFFIPVLLIKLSSCTGIKSKAPKGIHGEYAFSTNTTTYITNGITKDSVLKIFISENLTVKNGRLNEYDAPFDSLRYLIGNIKCGKNDEQIEAYIEFKDKKISSTPFKIIWFNSSPTTDDKEYEMRTKEYYECFETLMKRCKIIK